jgi:hypothetical protein
MRVIALESRMRPTGLPVNTATRSAPEGASSAFAADYGAIGTLGTMPQPAPIAVMATTAAASSDPILFMRNPFSEIFSYKIIQR